MALEVTSFYSLQILFEYFLEFCGVDFQISALHSKDYTSFCHSDLITYKRQYLPPISGFSGPTGARVMHVVVTSCFCRAAAVSEALLCG